MWKRCIEFHSQAVLANCEALQFASPRLQRALALEAVRMNSSALRFLPELSRSADTQRSPIAAPERVHFKEVIEIDLTYLFNLCTYFIFYK